MRLERLTALATLLAACSSGADSAPDPTSAGGSGNAQGGTSAQGATGSGATSSTGATGGTSAQGATGSGATSSTGGAAPMGCTASVASSFSAGDLVFGPAMECCDQADACTHDASCVACANGTQPSGQACSPAYNALKSCLAEQGSLLPAGSTCQSDVQCAGQCAAWPPMVSETHQCVSFCMTDADCGPVAACYHDQMNLSDYCVRGCSQTSDCADLNETCFNPGGSARHFCL